MYTDPIADYLTRVRNAVMANHKVVEIPASNLKKEITKILFDQGYILSYKFDDNSVQGTIKIALKYDKDTKDSVIKDIQRISKPGLRKYAGAAKLPRILNGLGIAIVSTSKGLMTGKQAKQLNVVGTKKGDAILGKALKDVARCKGSNRKNFEEAVRMHHIMQQMTAFVNNRDVKYTRYSNFNEEVYQDKNGVSVRVIDDIADGVSKPCYMNPHHNPGFSTTEDETTGCVTGTPTNQNPSHIESSLPKNLLKA